MNKERLEQLESLKDEIKDIHDSIEKLEKGVTHTYVKGSRKRLPYDVQYITVTGLRSGSARKLEEKKGQYKQKIDELQREVDELEAWIDSISDSQMRRIMRMRYQQGLSWGKIGIAIGYHRTAVQKKHDVFLKDSHNSHFT